MERMVHNTIVIDKHHFRSNRLPRRRGGKRGEGCSTMEKFVIRGRCTEAVESLIIIIVHVPRNFWAPGPAAERDEFCPRLESTSSHAVDRKSVV